MDAPFPAFRTPEEALPEGLTVSKAIARWRENRRVGERPFRPEPLLAPGELHGVMPTQLRHRRREAKRPDLASLT